MDKTFTEILNDTTLNNLAKRLNKRYPYMSEQDLTYIINDVLKTGEIIRRRKAS